MIDKIFGHIKSIRDYADSVLIRELERRGYVVRKEKE